MTWGPARQPGIFWDPRERPPPHHPHAEFLSSDPWRQQEWSPQRPRIEPESPWYQVDETIGVSLENAPAPSDGFLPPVSVSVNASITHDTAKVTVTQEFMNSTHSLIPKARYTFPLPPGSSVVDFSCRIGRDRLLRGKVKPKAAARETFQEAVRQNQAAGLLDQNSPELFTTTLGNLPADIPIKATLSFIVLLKHSLKRDSSGTHMTFVLPTYIAPRYGTAPSVIDHLLNRSASLATLSFSVDILAASGILALTCPSHTSSDIQIGVARHRRWNDFVANRVTPDFRYATVRLPDDTTCLDRDFTLDICITSAEVPERPFACLEKHPEFPGQSALMLTIPPKYLLGPSGEYPGGEIVFVADRSGSMRDKIDALKKAMEFFLAALPPGSSFNICSFGTYFTRLWSHSQPYNAANCQAAEAHVMTQFRADMGETKILGALKQVVASRGGFGNTDVIVLTDGQIWDLQETIEFVKQTRKDTAGQVRFFSLGIGNAVSHELVEGIAKAGGGYAEVIQTASRGGWEGRMLAILEAAKEPHAFPRWIGINWVDENDEGTSQYASSCPINTRHKPFDICSAAHMLDDTSNETFQSPLDISMLSPFMRNRVLVLLNHHRESAVPRAVWINCSRPGMDEESVEVPVTVAETPDTIIHKFAARALLGDLERGESYIHTRPNAPGRDSAEERELVRREGEKLGCKWSLVSKWTSFVAVEEAVDEDPIDEDSLMDGDPVGGRGAIGEGRRLNLLRPRGDRNVTRRIEGHAEQIESDDETRDASGDEPDTGSDRNGRHRGDDSNDSDDDQGGGPCHGNAGKRDAGPESRGDHDGSYREKRSHSRSEPEVGSQQGSSQSMGGRNLGGAVAHGASIIGPATTTNFGNPVRHRALGVDDIFFDTKISFLSSAKLRSKPKPSTFEQFSNDQKSFSDKRIPINSLSPVHDPFDTFGMDDVDETGKKTSTDKEFSKRKKLKRFSYDANDARGTGRTETLRESLKR